MRRLLLGAAGVAGAILTWSWGASRLSSVVSPQATLRAMGELLRDAEFWSATLSTITIALMGLAAAMTVSVVAGILIGWFPAVRHAVHVTFEFLKPIPPIVIMPVAILVLVRHFLRGVPRSPCSRPFGRRHLPPRRFNFTPMRS